MRNGKKMEKIRTWEDAWRKREKFEGRGADLEAKEKRYKESRWRRKRIRGEKSDEKDKKEEKAMGR